MLLNTKWWFGWSLSVHWFLQVDNPHWLIIALILLHTRMDHVQTLTVHVHLIECWVKSEEVTLGQICDRKLLPLSGLHLFYLTTRRCRVSIYFLFRMQVYGLIISTHRICTRFYDPGKWLLSAQVYQQFFRGTVWSVQQGKHSPFYNIFSVSFLLDFDLELSAWFSELW